MTRWIAAILAAAALAGCSHMPERSAPTVPAGAKVDIGDSELVKKKLYAQYSEWKGTRYEIGGMSRHGVDCSGFVYLTFKSKLGMVLPRTTESQADLGRSVDRGELRTGDLIFFKTGWFGRHVGMYLEHGRFLHASSTKGVTISRLNEDYWKSAYWKAKRVAS